MCSRIYMKTLPKLIPKFGTFVPNYFLHKDVGGLGLSPPEGWKFGVTFQQRKIGTYFVRHRSEIALKEKIYEMPRAVERALEKLGHITPAGDNWYIDGKPVQGPLLPEEDLSEYLNSMMLVALRSTQWVRGNGKSLGEPDKFGNPTPNRIVTHNWKKAMEWGEAPMKVRKLKCYEPSRQVARVIRPPIVSSCYAESETSEEWKLREENNHRLLSLPKKVVEKETKEDFRVKRESYQVFYRDYLF